MVGRLLASAVIVCTTSFAQVPRPETPAARTFAVRGRVVAASRDPLPRALVLVAAGGEEFDAVFTDDRGRFTIAAREAANITLTVSKAGYASRRHPVSKKAMATGVLPELQLEAGAAVSGRIVDASGAPSVATAVTVRSADDSHHDAAHVQWVSESDDRGEYRIGGLPAGRYGIHVGMKTDSRVLVDVKPGEDISGVNVVIDAAAPRSSRELMEASDGERAGRAAIHGRVLSELGEPLAGARVQLLRHGLGLHSATVGVDGRFSMSGVPAGRFILRGAKPGYVSLEYGQHHSTQTGRPIVVRDDETLRGMELVLPRGSAVVGTVMDEHGDPVEGAKVRALQLRSAAGRTLALPVAGVRERRTDDRGHYRLFGLLPGSYLITATVDGAISTAKGGKGQGYAPSFYPGTPNVADAWRVAVDVQRDVFGAHIVLAKSPAVRVSGMAFRSDGKGVNGFVLIATSQRSRATTLAPRRVNVSGGRFTFTNVPPGDYTIQVFAEEDPNHPPEFTSQSLTVGEIDPAPLTLTTAPGATFTGRVIVEGRTTREPERYSIMPFPSNFDFAPLIGRGAALDVDRESFFRIADVFGPTRFVLTGAPAGWYLKSITINGRDYTDTPFDFGWRYAFSGDGRIVISPTGATIVGQVTDDRANPIREYTVVAFPVDRNKRFPQSRYLKFARPAQDDSFEVDGLVPGEYLLAAIERIDATPGGGDWQDPEVLEKLSRQAQRFTVEEGGVLNVTLRPVRW